MFILIQWLTALASIGGVILNVQRRRACWLVYACTNASWVMIDCIYEIWPQAALQAVFFGLSLYGWRQWKEVKP